MRERKKMNKSNSRLESYPEIYLASFTRNGSYRNEIQCHAKAGHELNWDEVGGQGIKTRVGREVRPPKRYGQVEE